MIKNVIFDFADTIAEIHPKKQELVFKFFEEEYDLNIDKRKIVNNYKMLDHLMFYSSLKILSDNERYNYYKEYNKKLIMSMGLYHLSEGIETKLYEYFKYSNRKWILKPGVNAIFKRLKMHEINLGLISNFSNKLSRIIDELNLKRYINYFLASQDVGLEKPNRSFYELFLSKSSFHNSETIYVGDNYILDYLPATALGLRTYLLDEDEFFCLQDITIKSIKDVIILVKRLK